MKWQKKKIFNSYDAILENGYKSIKTSSLNSIFKGFIFLLNYISCLKNAEFKRILLEGKGKEKFNIFIYRAIDYY